MWNKEVQYGQKPILVELSTQRLVFDRSYTVNTMSTVDVAVKDKTANANSKVEAKLKNKLNAKARFHCFMMSVR